MPTPDNPSWVSLTQGNFDLFHKGETDRQRFKRRVEQVVKGNLPGIISDESVITSDGQKTVKVPIRGLDIPHFRHGLNDKGEGGLGQGQGQPGDVFDQGQEEAGSLGRAAGDAPGIDYIEAEYTIDELAELVFKDLGLPFLRPKPQQEEESEDVRFSDIRKRGPMSNLDKRRTIRENLKRNARVGQPFFGGIIDDDLRFKTWERDVRPQTNAVVLAMRDVSGSMGDFEKYITRALFFWVTRFLRTQYKNVEIAFITHHTEAKEVDEQTFFALGESGGTKASSAYQLALEIMKDRYPSARWNRYPMHASDGDNWGEADNTLCLDSIREMLEKEACNAFGYFEIQADNRRSTSTLMSAYQDYPDEHLISAIITSKGDVFPALQAYFDPTKKDEGVR